MRTSAHNDTVSSFGSVFHHTSRGFKNGLAIDEIEFRSVDAAFIAAAKKRLEKSIVQRIITFLASFDHTLRAVRESCDLLSLALVP